MWFFLGLAGCGVLGGNRYLNKAALMLHIGTGAHINKKIAYIHWKRSYRWFFNQLRTVLESELWTSGRVIYAFEYRVTSPTEFLYFDKNCGVVLGFRMLILSLLSFLWMLRKSNHYTVKFREVSAKLSVMPGIVMPGWIFSCELFFSIHH